MLCQCRLTHHQRRFIFIVPAYGWRSGMSVVLASARLLGTLEWHFQPWCLQKLRPLTGDPRWKAAPVNRWKCLRCVQFKCPCDVVVLENSWYQVTLLLENQCCSLITARVVKSGQYQVTQVVSNVYRCVSKWCSVVCSKGWQVRQCLVIMTSKILKMIRENTFGHLTVL